MCDGNGSDKSCPYPSRRSLRPEELGPHKTVKEVRVNGKRVKENKIPFAKKGTTCKVEIEIK